MSDKIWVNNTETKYPEELLNGRLNAECNVIGLIFNDPLILDEINLTTQDFLSIDGRFYFGVARQLKKLGINDFSEVAILSNLDQKVLDQFNLRGGYQAIYNIVSLISVKNKDSILDSITKYNTFIKLYECGFNLLSPMEIGNRTVVPLEFFKGLDSNSILEWYEVQLSKMGTGYDVKLLEDSDVEITDEFIDSLSAGDEQGVSYGCAGEDVEGNPMSVFPFLSNQTLGFVRSASHYIAGFSSVGKTAMMCSIVLALVNNGEKVLIICNEQSSKTWKINFLVFVLYKHFRYMSITKSDLMAGKLNDEDRKMLRAAQDYFNEKFGGMIHFIQMAENDMNVVKSKIRFYALQHGYSTVVYDTFKISDTNKRDRSVASWDELVQASRDLDRYAKKYDLIMLCSIQIAQSFKGVLFLDSSMLSGAKGIVEQLDTLLCVRDVYKEELDPDSKFYCNPFQYIKNDSTGKWEEKEYLCDPQLSWKMVFLTKSRNSENSSSSQSALMFRFMGQFAVFQEKCWCRPKHGYIQ